MSDAEETSTPTDVESTATKPAPPTNAAPDTPAPSTTPEAPAQPVAPAKPAATAATPAQEPQDSPDPPPDDPNGGSFDQEFKSIIQESQPLVLGGDDENKSTDAPEAAQTDNRARTNEEEDARAMARARAERNRLKKVASTDESKSSAPRERDSAEPREKFKAPKENFSDEPARPLRDYGNQEDWQQAQRGSFSTRLARVLKFAGSGLGIIMILAAGWIIYSEIQRSQNIRSDGGLVDMVEKMATDRQEANEDPHDPDEEEPGMPQTRPDLPPSQQLEALISGAGGAGIGKDIIRNLQMQVKSIKQDLKIIKSKRNQVEKSLTNIDTILKALSRADKNKRTKSKRKRAKSPKRKTP